MTSLAKSRWSTSISYQHTTPSAAVDVEMGWHSRRAGLAPTAIGILCQIADPHLNVGVAQQAGELRGIGFAKVIRVEDLR